MSARIFRFLVSGVSAAAAEYVAFLALQWSLGPDWLYVNQSLSFAIGFVVSFSLNRTWVFQSSNPLSAELIKYGLIAACNLAAGNVVIWVLTGPLELNEYLSKFMVMALIASWNYLIFSKLVFRQSAGSA